MKNYFGMKVNMKNSNKKPKNTSVSSPTIRKSKKNIPRRIREKVWTDNFGKQFERSCYVHWCKNKINVFNFHTGHNEPESKGGNLDLSNLRPLCSRCNQSMSNGYTIDEWQKLYPSQHKTKLLLTSGATILSAYIYFTYISPFIIF